VKLLLAVLPLLAACGTFTGGQGDRPQGFRLVTGTLLIPEEDLLGRQVTGLQIAAIAIGKPDAPGVVDVFPSAIFDPSRVENAAFVAPVDGERSFVLILQVPSQSGRGPGAFLGVLEFADGRGGTTTLVPKGLDDIDLGAVSVKSGPDAPADNVLEVGDANNPLGQIDTDDDGAPDLSDDDDDGDETPDASDLDLGGDGVEDASQILRSLPDSDQDGIPDVLAG
jgi:hypothetical protein